MRDDIWVCESIGMRLNGSYYGFNLYYKDFYYIIVVVCNGVCRCLVIYSDGVIIDIILFVMEYVRDGIMGLDMDF